MFISNKYPHLERVVFTLNKQHLKRVMSVSNRDNIWRELCVFSVDKSYNYSNGHEQI